LGVGHGGSPETNFKAFRSQALNHFAGHSYRKIVLNHSKTGIFSGADTMDGCHMLPSENMNPNSTQKMISPGMLKTRTSRVVKGSGMAGSLDWLVGCADMWILLLNSACSLAFATGDTLIQINSDVRCIDLPLVAVLSPKFFR
jgi:hypothetical protein